MIACGQFSPKYIPDYYLIIISQKWAVITAQGAQHNY